MFDRRDQGEIFEAGGLVTRPEGIYKLNRQIATAFQRVPTSRDVWTILDNKGGSWVVT
ncbi:hypothetical protein MKX03_031655, partial [Papaver bracteatum]